LETLRAFLQQGEPRQIVTVNLDFLRQAQRLPQFNHVLNEADLAVPDGQPLVWMARYLDHANCERVTGPDVIDAGARLSAETGKSIFLLGGEPGAAERAKAVLEQRYAGVRISGVYAPPLHDYPFPKEVDEDIKARIRAAAADMLFVAFGCPKQDFWIYDHLKELGVSIAVGIGGSFNFLGGLVPRAPSRLQHLGLEWVYRLYREPRRLWRRYLVHDLPFALRLLAAEAGRRIGLFRRPVLSRDV
jgi:N-acetylglucosaminyldiphosphoundecaprenol N-acetyl-beta-D-mannosaminyltransferase